MSTTAKRTSRGRQTIVTVVGPEGEFSYSGKAAFKAFAVAWVRTFPEGHLACPEGGDLLVASGCSTHKAAEQCLRVLALHERDRDARIVEVWPQGGLSVEED